MALWLGQALHHSGALDEAYETLSDVVDRSGGQGGDAMLELEAYLLSIASLAGRMPETARRAASLRGTHAGRLAGRGRGSRRPWRSGRRSAASRASALRERVQRALVDIQRGAASSSTSQTGKRRA